MHLRDFCAATLSMLLIATTVQAQIFRIDARSFPIVRLWHVPTNYQQQMPPVTVLDNGAPAYIIDYTCASRQYETPSDIVLAVDISSSNAEFPDGRQLLDTFITTFIENVPPQPTRIHLVAFNNTAHTVASGYAPAVLEHMRGIMFGGGTNYAAVFESAARILRAQTNTTRSQWVILLTDGLDTIDIAFVQSLFGKQLPHVAIVMVRNETPLCLRDLALASDGGWFELIRNPTTAAAIAQTLARLLNGTVQLCTLTYQSVSTCDTLHSIQLQYPLIAYGMRYSTDKNGHLDVSSSHVYFGMPLKGTTRHATVTLTARNVPIAIDTIWLKGSVGFTLDSAPVRRVLQPNEALNVTVRYTARDTAPAWAELFFATSCGTKTVTWSVGRRFTRVTPSYFQLIEPRSGERFFSGTDVVLRWTGIPPDDSCTVSISYDDGKSWTLLSSDAHNNSYRWKVPPLSSTQKALFRLTRHDNNGQMIETAQSSAPIVLDPPTGILAPTDVGQAVIGIRKDTVIRALIRNPSQDHPLTVEGISFVGDNPTDFGLAQGYFPTTIPPRGSLDVELFFRPQQPGRRSSELLVRTTSGYVRQLVWGHGIMPSQRHYIVDFGPVIVGTTGRQDLTLDLSVSLQRAGKTGDHHVFSVSQESLQVLQIRFRPDSTRQYTAYIRFSDSLQPVVITLQGQGVIPQTAISFSDPTHFRIVALPTATPQSIGTLSIGSYNGAGLIASYVPVRSATIFAGGLIPITLEGKRSSAIGAGATISVPLSTSWSIAGGVALGRSSSSSRSDTTTIDLFTPFALATTQLGIVRISGGIGYVFKEHRTPQHRFRADIPVMALGADWQVGQRWKLAAEAYSIGTLDATPLAIALRFFGKQFSIDAGAILGIPTGNSRLYIFPLLSAFWVFN